MALDARVSRPQAEATQRSMEPIIGTPGNDSPVGTAAADVINGCAGDDTLQGGECDDILKMGNVADTVSSGDATAAATHLAVPDLAIAPALAASYFSLVG